MDLQKQLDDLDECLYRLRQLKDASPKLVKQLLDERNKLCDRSNERRSTSENQRNASTAKPAASKQQTLL